MVHPLYRIKWIWKLSSAYKNQLESITYIDEFVNDLIEKRRSEIIAKKGDGVSESENVREKPALLDILLQSEMDGKPLTNEDIRGEVNTFM